MAYYIQKEVEGVQIACKIAYAFNRRPPDSKNVKSIKNRNTSYPIIRKLSGPFYIQFVGDLKAWLHCPVVKLS